MMKINFKQPKYIFPLVVFVPLCALVYFVMQTFGEAVTRGRQWPPTASTWNCRNIAEEAGDKMTEMSRRFGDEDALPPSVPSARRKRTRRSWNTATARRS